MNLVVVAKTMVQLAGESMTLEEEHNYALALLHALLQEQTDAGHRVEGWDMEMKMHLVTINVTYTKGKSTKNDY